MMKHFAKIRFLVSLAAVLGTISIYSLGFTNIDDQRDERGLKLGKTKEEIVSGTGKYYALIIGNDDYLNIEKLKTAVNDAKAISEALRNSYNFETNLLLNANREQIIKAINQYRHSLDENTSLLIYYAGHGYYDKDVDKAYWLPIDAEQNDNAKWISSDDMITNIKGMTAKHILIISDSCFSGMISRGMSSKLKPIERERYIKKMVDSKSRILISSGGNEPVSDSGTSNHSIFANAVLHGLETMEENVYTSDELFFQFIRQQVAGKADQTPQYSPIRNSGHDFGEFVFIRKIPYNSKKEPHISIQGKWIIMMAAPRSLNDAFPVKGTLDITQTGDTISGSFKSDGIEVSTVNGTLIGKNINFSVQIPISDKEREDKNDAFYQVQRFNTNFSGIAGSESMSGTWSMGIDELVISDTKSLIWTASRLIENEIEKKNSIEIPANTDIEVELLNQLNIDAADNSFKFEVLVITPEQLAGYVISAQGYRVPLTDPQEGIGVLLAFDDSHINFIDTSIRIAASVVDIPSRRDIKFAKQGVIPISNTGRILQKGTRLIIRTQAKVNLPPR